jgi:hypothetical protein
MDRFKEFTGLGEKKEKSLGEQMEESCCKSCGLTRTQRVYGFGICFTLGWIVSFASCLALPDIVEKPENFALLYTLGNVITLCSTLFLYGPWSQIKKMFDKTRVIATSVYLAALVLTLVAAFAVGELWLVILCLIVQFLAMLWYCLSYVPYGRTIVLKCMGCK